MPPNHIVRDAIGLVSFDGKKAFGGNDCSVRFSVRLQQGAPYLNMRLEDDQSHSRTLIIDLAKCDARDWDTGMLYEGILTCDASSAWLY